MASEHEFAVRYSLAVTSIAEALLRNRMPKSMAARVANAVVAQPEDVEEVHKEPSFADRLVNRYKESLANAGKPCGDSWISADKDCNIGIGKKVSTPMGDGKIVGISSPGTPQATFMVKLKSKELKTFPLKDIKSADTKGAKPQKTSPVQQEAVPVEKAAPKEPEAEVTDAEAKPLSEKEALKSWTEHTKDNWDASYDSLDETLAAAKASKHPGELAMQAFSSHLFTEINTTPDHDVSKIALDYVKSLPAAEEDKIFRVVAFPDDKSRTDFLSKIGEAGDFVQHRTFSSWTREDPTKDGATAANNIAIDLASQFGDSRVFITLHKPQTARDISFVYAKDGKTKKGTELLVTRGTKLRLKKTTKKKGDVHIELEEVDDEKVKNSGWKPWPEEKISNRSEEERAEYSEHTLAIAAALGEAFADLRKRVEAVAAIEDPIEQLDAIGTLREALPAELKATVAGKELVAAIEDALAGEATDGAVDAVEAIGLAGGEEAATGQDGGKDAHEADGGGLVGKLAAALLLAGALKSDVPKLAEELAERARITAAVTGASVLGNLEAKLAEAEASDSPDERAVIIEEALGEMGGLKKSEPDAESGAAEAEEEPMLPSSTIRSLEGTGEIVRGFGYFKAATTERALAEYPAQELYRAEDRKIWRDWPARWEAQNGSFYPDNDGGLFNRKSSVVERETDSKRTPTLQNSPKLDLHDEEMSLQGREQNDRIRKEGDSSMPSLAQLSVVSGGYGSETGRHDDRKEGRNDELCGASRRASASAIGYTAELKP